MQISHSWVTILDLLFCHSVWFNGLMTVRISCSVNILKKWVTNLYIHCTACCHSNLTRTNCGNIWCPFLIKRKSTFSDKKNYSIGGKKTKQKTLSNFRNLPSKKNHRFSRITNRLIMPPPWRKAYPRMNVLEKRS